MKKLKFEWDEEKERKNIKAHKIDERKEYYGYY